MRAFADQASLARRTPVNCQRAAGEKKLRYEALLCPRGVAQLAPLSTNCPHMNLPLYSPTAPAAGPKPGYEAKALCVHSHTSPNGPPPASGMTAAASSSWLPAAGSPEE